MKKSRRLQFVLLSFCGVLGGFLLAACGQQHLRTGETGLTKIRPSRSFLVEDIASAPFLLEARGFSLSDYGDKLPAASTDLGLLAPAQMRQLAERIYTQAEQRIFALQLRGDSQNSNEIQSLRTIQAEVDNVLTTLPKSGTNDSQTSFVNEIYFSLLDQRVSLEQAEVVLQSVKATLEKDPTQARNPEYILRYFGIPLISEKHYKRWPDAEVHEATNVNGKNFGAHSQSAETNKCTTATFFYFDCNFVTERKKTLQKLLTTFTDLASYTDSNQLSNALDDIATDSALYAQDFLNLASALGLGGRPINGTNDIVPRTRKLVTNIRTSQIECTSINDMFARLTRNGQKTRDLIDVTIAAVNRAFQQAVYKDRKILLARAKLEELNKEIKKKTRENRFHRLAKDSMVTIELKTLYLRYADNLPSRTPPTHARIQARAITSPKQASVVEQRGASILAMARVKNEESRDDSNYPILFEPDYAGAHFVNVLDRFVYGPQAYRGKAINFQFSVLHLRDLNNSNIMSGFKAVSGAVALANPEFAALSPVVNSLFSSILNAATKNQTELDCSFTIPPLEGDNKADTDFLVAETGHYILIKKENRFREGLEDRQSTERDFYRKLIYNPIDSRLYHRKFYGNPEMNFTSGNLFTNQSYAVLAITDEYTEPDDLAKIMRDQVSKRVNERRAAAIIPNDAEARSLFDTLRHGLGISKEPSVSGSVLTNLVQNLKQELWEPTSEVRQEFIIQLLSQNADDGTRLSLGTDPEKWKRANLIVKDQKLTLVPLTAHQEHLPEPYTVVLPANPSVPERLFGNVGGLEGDSYFLLASSASGELLSLSQSGWWGTLSDKGVLNPPVESQTDSLSSDSFRVTARRVDNQSLHAVRDVVFIGRPFEISTTLTNKTIFTNQISVETNTIVTLAVSTEADDPKYFSWKLGGATNDVAITRTNGTPLQSVLFTEPAISLSLKPGKTNAHISVSVRHHLFRKIGSSTNDIQEREIEITFGK